MPTIYSPSTVAPPDRSRPARQRARAVVSAVLSVVLALLGVVGLASPAAAGVDHVSGHWGHYGTIPTWWGTMTFSGRYGLCVDPGVLPPTLLDDATAHKVCGNSTGGTPDDNAQLAYLLARYLDTDDEATAVSLSQIGRGQYHDGIPVSYPNRLGQMLDEARRNAGPKDAFIQVDADALRLWYGLVRRGESSRDFSHFHPGYTATLRITTPNVTFTDGSQTMTVTTKDAAASVPLISRHDLIADEKVSVTVTIGGIESSCYLRHEPGGHHQRVATPLRESASASATHAPKVTRWQPKVTTEISTPTLTKDAASVTDRVKADAVNGSQWPVREWANAIQTQPKTYYSFTATGDLVRASTPPAPSTSLPAGASVVATGAKATLTGPGVWTTTTVPMSDGYGSGHYALRWCLDAAAQGVNAKYLPIGGPFCDSYFADSERFIVPMTLGISSQVPVRFHPKGQAPDDTITVFLPDSCDQWIARADGTPATLTATGIFCAASDSTFTPSDTPPADAQILGTASVTVTLPTSGRNPVTVDAPAGFTVPTAQYGVWIWHINRADQTPDVAALFDNDPTDTFGQISETHVTQMDLTIASEVTHATIPEPADDGQIEVCDTVWLEQGSEGDLWLNQWGTTTPVEVLVTGSLFHSAVPAAMTLNPDPATTNKVADFSLAFTAAGRDRAQTVCHPVSHGQYGAYGFMYSIEPDKQPAATRDFLAHGDATPLWLPVETTMVRRQPVIHTTASSWKATLGGQSRTFFHDDIWQTGWPDGPTNSAMPAAIGHGEWPGYDGWQADVPTITTQLWRINGEITPESCTADNPAASLIAVNTATPAANTWAASQKVSGSTFTATGDEATYTFVVSFPGDARVEPYRSTCGEPSETITTPITPEPEEPEIEAPEPSITTNAPAHAIVGQQVTDEAQLTGPFPAGTVIEFWMQHTPYDNPDAAQEERVCVSPDPHDMTGARLIGRVNLPTAIQARESQVIHSNQFTSKIPGCTHIKEIAYPPDTTDAPAPLVEGWFGQPGETTQWNNPTPERPQETTPTASMSDTGVHSLLPTLVILISGSLLLMTNSTKRKQQN